MPLAGEQLSLKEALALCWVVGFRGPKLVTAVAVMCAESGRWTGAWHDNLDEDGNVLSTDRGLFQINSVHQMSGDPFDPVRNADKAFELSKEGADWHLWSAYNSGAHEKFVAGIYDVKELNTWQSREKLWQ